MAQLEKPKELRSEYPEMTSSAINSCPIARHTILDDGLNPPEPAPVTVLSVDVEMAEDLCLDETDEVALVKNRY